MAIRHAIRSLVRSPWYAVTAIGTITLTIALSATVFAVIDGVLFRPLPYPDADRVFRVTGVDATGGSASLAPADVRYLADAHPGILVAPYRARGSVVRPAQPDLALATTLVGPRFFDLLGQTPVIGGFAPEHFDARPPEAPTPALVTHALWRQWLGEDPSPVGRVIDVVGGRLEIVGVLPDDFVFPVSRGTSVPDLLLPLVATSDSLNRWARSVTTLARLDAAAIDVKNTRRLQEIVAGHGWPSPDLVGQDGAGAAHTPPACVVRRTKGTLPARRSRIP